VEKSVRTLRLIVTLSSWLPAGLALVDSEPIRYAFEREREVSPGHAQGMTTGRVRSEHQVIAAAITDAAEHSATFRSMVESIGATDVIVYVREGRCTLGLRACLAAVQKTPAVRFVFVNVDTKRAVGCELMASIGHELQHALEVAQNPRVVDNDTLAHFYMHLGPTGSDRFETAAAVRAGLLVGQEVRARCR
jgi:hypothetical protein